MVSFLLRNEEVQRNCHSTAWLPFSALKNAAWVANENISPLQMCVTCLHMAFWHNTQHFPYHFWARFPLRLEGKLRNDCHLPHLDHIRERGLKISMLCAWAALTTNFQEVAHDQALAQVFVVFVCLFKPVYIQIFKHTHTLISLATIYGS